MDVPADVLALAFHPFRELPAPPGGEKVERAGFVIVFSPYPTAQMVEVRDLAAAAVPTAVADARALARERGKRLLAWCVAPEHDHLAPALEQEGLVNEDTPGAEAIETAMVLLERPMGESD